MQNDPNRHPCIGTPATHPHATMFDSCIFFQIGFFRFHPPVEHNADLPLCSFYPDFQPNSQILRARFVQWRPFFPKCRRFAASRPVSNPCGQLRVSGFRDALRSHQNTPSNHLPAHQTAVSRQLTVPHTSCVYQTPPLHSSLCPPPPHPCRAARPFAGRRAVGTVVNGGCRRRWHTHRCPEGGGVSPSSLEGG